MRTYPQRVRDNILPLSVGSTLPEAFEEWSFTDNTVDHVEPIATCELCDQEELRYHFKIKNALTHKCLWVGSQCILKFNLSVFEDGRRLSPVESKKKLDRLMQQMRLQSCINALQKLASSEENQILSSALTYYVKNKYLTPRFAYVVLWRLQARQIDHGASFFKVNLAKKNTKMICAKCLRVGCMSFGRHYRQHRKKWQLRWATQHHLPANPPLQQTGLASR